MPQRTHEFVPIVLLPWFAGAPQCAGSIRRNHQMADGSAIVDPPLDAKAKQGATPEPWSTPGFTGVHGALKVTGPAPGTEPGPTTIVIHAGA